MIITAGEIYYSELNRQIKESSDHEITLKNVLGQRYIGCGCMDKNIEIHGTSGNALGAYMSGGSIEVFGNAQDATGDTMNDGQIIIHGNCGDATGYGMRGGEIYIQGNAGYRVGIHMKEYQDIKPVLVIGGKTGDFLGEYQAGGIILVLGLNEDRGNPVGNFCGTGMHGGTIYIRSDSPPANLPKQVNVCDVSNKDLEIIKKYVRKYCEFFNVAESKVLPSKFIKLVANTKNPYKQLYTHN
ncbi:glutamate synthase [Bacillota bacterium LX-D]|nr:glutamate synthase [Bacillota bacterium LX-D]